MGSILKKLNKLLAALDAAEYQRHEAMRKELEQLEPMDVDLSHLDPVPGHDSVLGKIIDDFLRNK